MTLPTIIAHVMLLSLIVYGITGGADYGGGIWDLLASGPRARKQRDAIAAAIGPIWEANHVWLIIVIVLLFAAFPPAFGAIMTALHIPLTLVLIGIVLRGSAFVFRKYDTQHDHVHRRWSTIFGAASLLTPLFLGLSLGALGTGAIRMEAGLITTGFFAGWTTPFAICVGLFAQGLFAYLAAVYLTVDTEGQEDVQNDFRRRALVSGLLLAPAAALVFVLGRHGAPLLAEAMTAWWAPWLWIATSGCALGGLWALWQRRFRLSRVFAGGQVALILAGWGAAQYPYLIAPDLTFADAATQAEPMRAILWILIGGSVLLLPSFAYLFYVFKRRGAPLEADEAH